MVSSGLRDEENRDLLIFPVPDKDTFPTYDELYSVCEYLLSIPKFVLKTVRVS